MGGFRTVVFTEVSRMSSNSPVNTAWVVGYEVALRLNKQVSPYLVKQQRRDVNRSCAVYFQLFFLLHYGHNILYTEPPGFEIQNVSTDMHIQLGFLKNDTSR